MWIFESVRGIATTVCIFITLAITTGFISANVRVFASKRGFDTFLDRFAEHPRIAAAIREAIEWYSRMISGWPPLQRRWWLWLALGLSFGVAATLWATPEVQRAAGPTPPQIPTSVPQQPQRYTAYEKEQRLRAIDEIYNVFATQISPAFTEGHTMLIGIVATIGNGTAEQKLSDHAKNVETAFSNLSASLKKWEYFPDIVQATHQKPMFNGLNETNASRNLIGTIALFKSAVQPSYFTQLIDRDVTMLELRNANADFETYLKNTMPALQRKRGEIASAQVMGEPK